MFTFHRIRRRSSRLIRGFTLAEVMIASSISGLILLGVLSLQFITAKTIKELYGPTRTRSSRMNAINQVRYRLCDARIGSCVVSDSNRRIQFQDPNLGAGVVSEFHFILDENALYYDADVANSAPVKVAAGPIEITFTLGSKDLDPNGLVYMGTDGLVTVFVQTSAELGYANVDLRDGETVIHLRNPS